LAAGEQQMKKEFLPYYISRLILSAVFSILVWGFTWTAALMGIVFFGLFLLYFHSGWFSIDLENPLFPLRRDSHGQAIQRKALIIAVVLGILLYTFAAPLVTGQLALSIAIVGYFVAQFSFFIKAQLQEHLSN
jgi:hypothetical protein